MLALVSVTGSGSIQTKWVKYQFSRTVPLICVLRECVFI